MKEKREAIQQSCPALGRIGERTGMCQRHRGAELIEGQPVYDALVQRRSLWRGFCA
jgi:hypothetical protein